MAIEKQSSKGGNYVGGFLQLFDWNAKSRKKLFSSKSDLPEQSKQKKRCNGNLPLTQLQMLDEDDVAAGSSIKGISDYSRASSVTDEDFYGTRGPGVVARLMGLDSLPKSNSSEPYSTPLFDSQSLCDAHFRTKNFEYCQDPEVMHSSTLQEVPVRNNMEPKYQKVIHRPIKKFQTEILPPKSAKSVPITHHKLLSPIKSVNYIPPKDAAHIMEAAAKIIEPGPQSSTKTKLPLVGSSFVPLRVKDLKEKVQAAQKPSKLSEGSQKPGESSAVKNLRGHSMNKSGNGSVDATPRKVFPESEESSVSVKNKGKTISLALQAKANVQKREGLTLNSSRSLASQKETSEFSPNQLFKSQPATQKSALKKPSTPNGSSVLRQNNQKQNCFVDRGKLPLTSKVRGGKAPSGDFSFARQKNSSKLSGTSKASSRKFGSDVKDKKREVFSSSSESVTHKKRSIDGNYLSGKNQNAHNTWIEKNGKVIQSSAIMERQSNWDQDSRTTGTDVISFTFIAPMTRLGPGSERSSEDGENCKIFSADCQSKRSLLRADGTSASKFSFLGHNVKGGEALSTVLEQKLKELTHKVEFSPRKSGPVLRDECLQEVPGLNALMSSTMPEKNKTKERMHTDNLGVLEEMGMRSSNISQARKLDCQLLSPISVLEHSSFVDSCNSSDTTDSNSTGGSKQCSSILAQEVLGTYSSKMFLPIEGEAELSDSASSTSAGTMARRQETAPPTLTDYGKQRVWELEYVKEILCNIELMFKDYALGNACEIIPPRLFDQLESWIGNLNGCGLVPRINQRVLFNCVNECLDMRCRQYVGGGCKLWAKGLSVVRRKERLAEDVYKEISGWRAMGDSNVDELVDKDMSNQYRRWLDFEIEALELGIQIESCILDSLIDGVVADILVL